MPAFLAGRYFELDCARYQDRIAVNMRTSGRSLKLSHRFPAHPSFTAVPLAETIIMLPSLPITS
jgi:hypothetical protein